MEPNQYDPFDMEAEYTREREVSTSMTTYIHRDIIDSYITGGRRYAVLECGHRRRITSDALDNPMQYYDPTAKPTTICAYCTEKSRQEIVS